MVGRQEVNTLEDVYCNFLVVHRPEDGRMTRERKLALTFRKQAVMVVDMLVESKVPGEPSMLFLIRW